jgi:DNA-binding response OmpR family regulator
MTEEQKTVLIVDDSAMLRRIVNDALDILDFKVLEAESAMAGQEQLENHEVDLIILDWVMPEKSGYDFFLELKEHKEFSTIPVIMLSAEDGKDMMLKAIRAGIRHYVTKPFTHEDLLARVVQVLKLSM